MPPKPPRTLYRCNLRPSFSVPLAVLEDPLSPELLQALIDELPYEVELLVGAVPEAEHSESDALE